MKITDLLSKETINLDAKAKDKTDILNQAIDLMDKSKTLTNKQTYKDGVFAREKISTTGVGEGIAIPHCKSNSVTKPQLVAMVIKDGVDYESLDGEPVKLLFLIAAPDSKDNVHLDVLARLSGLLMHEEFKDSLLAAKTKEEFLAAIDKAELEAQKENEPQPAETSNWPTLVCVTGCPTGIAHTYMAQEAIEKVCREQNITVKIETRGQEPKNILTDEEIAHAKAVIIAADIAVPMERFDGKQLVSVGTSKAIKNAKDLVAEALSSNCGTYKAAVSTNKSSSNSQQTIGKKENGFKKLYKHLLSGLSHMIPFVVAGGILMSISYIIDRCCGVDPAKLLPGQIFGQVNIIAMIFNIIGANVILGLMIPILAGFISYSIAGKQGLVSGFAAGVCATTLYLVGVGTTAQPEGYKLAFNFLWFLDVGRHGLPIVLQDNSLAWLAVKFSPGFFGGLFGGFAAGYGTLLFRKAFAKFSRSFQGVRDILLIPLCSALFITISMLFINAGFTYVTFGINKGLSVFQGAKGLGLMIALGIILAAVCAIDMGGPVSKAAHLLTIDWITTALDVTKTPGGITSDFGEFASTALGASIAGSMVPPICIAFACWLFPQKFSREDRKPAAANLITGIFGITEGAIPYCIARPKTWIATITGSIAAGIISVLLDGRAISPEGGTIAFMVATSVTARAMFAFVAVMMGSIIAAFLLGIIYENVNPEDAQLGSWKGLQIGFKSAEERIHALNVKLANAKPEFNELAYEDYINRIESLKKDLEKKIAEKKEKLDPKEFKPYMKKAHKAMKDLDRKLVNKRISLYREAKERAKTFDSAKFTALQNKISTKIAKIKENEVLKAKKLEQKKKAEAAKKEAKAEKAAAQLARKQNKTHQIAQ